MPAKSTIDGISRGVYQKMVDTIFPVNLVTTTYTQESYYSWRLFGSPYQLLDDPVLGEMTNSGFLGEWYINQLRQSQILTVKLGIPKYTGNKKGIGMFDYVNAGAQAIAQGQSVVSTISESVMAAIGMGVTNLNEAKRNYIFYNQYEAYMMYVKLLIVSMAAYLGVLSMPIPTLGNEKGGGGYTTISEMEWETYSTSGMQVTSAKMAVSNSLSWFAEKTGELVDKALKRDNLKPSSSFGDSYYDIAAGPPAIVQFIVTPEYGSDSFSNTTTTSVAQGYADQAYDVGKQVAWLTNVGDNSVLNAVQGITSAGATQMQTLLDNTVSDPAVSILGSSVIGMIRGLTGERMIFPEIYDKSSFNKGMSYNIKLVSPYGDNYSFFMNIGLPLCYLIPMVAPRTSSVNAYRMPFMCQTYVTGQTAVPMAIVEQLSITRGASGAMNKDGLPLDVDVRIGFKDLYSSIAVSAINDPAQFLSNESLIEYIASFTQIDTWNKSIMNQYLAGDVAGRVWSAGLEIDSIIERIKFNLGEYASNQMLMYGVANASR